jgi:hypothetical protein
MMMIVEQLVECELAEEAEVLGENLLQCHFVHHKSQAWSWATAVGSQQLSAWTMAQPYV